MADPFLDSGSRIVTIDAFDFIFKNELKRAVRAQNFLTLIQLDHSSVPPNERATVLRELSSLVSGDVRETDLVTESDGRVWLLLLDTDFRSANMVADRVLSRLRHYVFSTPIRCAFGAACCPTHGTDVDTLKHAAAVRRQRESSGTP